jgi:hypothetical protein
VPDVGGDPGGDEACLDGSSEDERQLEVATRDRRLLKSVVGT